MQSTPADVADHPWHPVHDRLGEIVRPRAGEVIVDLGRGSGGSLAALTARGAAACPVGPDLHASRLREAAGRVPGAPPARAGLTRPLPLATTSVDAVLGRNVMELLPDPSTLLGEVLRVVRPTARAVRSYADFAGLVVHGAEPGLTGRILHAYAHVQQPWIPHIDPFAAGTRHQRRSGRRADRWSCVGIARPRLPVAPGGRRGGPRARASRRGGTHGS